MTQVETCFILNGLLVENQACPKGSRIKFAEKSWYYVGWPDTGMGASDIWYWDEQKAILFSGRLICKRAQEAKKEGQKKRRREGGRGRISFLSSALPGRGYIPSAAKATPLPATIFFFLL